MCSEDEKHILLLKEAGLTVRQIIRVLELEKNVKHGDLHFLEKDVCNLFSRVKNQIAGSDVTNILEFLKSSKEKNKNFHFMCTVDDDQKLENLFWCPPQCFEWYIKYGDVVVFDTTYKVNIYVMPCAIFVGVNNHGKTVLFGFALLRNETTMTFRWLMKTFVGAMKKSPKTIITDQDQWMTEAIAKELPYTKHSFCIWHITYKFSGWFAFILRTEYQNWCKDFYGLYKLETSDEFESQWPLVVTKYNLQENKHIKGLYKIKEFWVPAYLRGYYFGGMTTTGRSDYINGFIKKFVSSNYTLTDLAKQVDIVVQEITQKQSHDNMLAVSKMDILKVSSPLERQVIKILTPFVFEKFKSEYQKARQYVIANFNDHNFVLRYHEGQKTKNQRVFWDGKIATCTCKQFEFVEILCRHILRVFIQADCHNIPPIYLPVRWQLHSSCEIDDVMEKDNSVLAEDVACPIEETYINGFENQRFDGDCTIDGESILCPPKSITKGRPKNKRIKSGKESVKQRRHCSMCRGIGHYANNCPDKESKDVPNDGIRKKKKVASNDTELNPIFTVKS